MERELLESLLNEDESSSLDFKRDQYPFDQADDAAKSEVVKDILAFSNAWRRTDAYILIGVDEVRGGRSKPVGVKTHLNEAHLQQLVNGKSSRPVEFSYEVVPVDGLEIGVIRIPVQTRPLYLGKDFGRLKRDTVYLRRGSSTAVAELDEVAKMGAPLAPTEPKPRLSLIGCVVFPHGVPEVLISIKNDAGGGVARWLRLTLLSFSGPFQASQYGIDGNHRTGLPELPVAVGSPRIFAGDAGSIIHPGTELQVTCIDYVGDRTKYPTTVRIDYELVAEGIAPMRSTLELPFV